MSTFPAKVWMNVPGTRYVNGNCKIIARIRPGDDVAAIQSQYGTRLMWFEIEADAIEETSWLKSLKGLRVRIHVDKAILFGSEEQMQALRQARPVFIVTPGENLLRQVNLITSIRFRVHIDASRMVSDSESLSKVTDFFLYNPVLMSPVEPMATLLAHLARGKGHSLWETEYERSSDAYLDEQGRITSSLRWAERGKFYGAIDDGWEILSSSPLAERLRRIRQTAIRAKNSCAICRQLELCRGYLKAPDPDMDCTPWQNCFEQLRAAVRKERKIRKILKG